MSARHRSWVQLAAWPLVLLTACANSNTAPVAPVPSTAPPIDLVSDGRCGLRTVGSPSGTLAEVAAKASEIVAAHPDVFAGSGPSTHASTYVVFYAQGKQDEARRLLAPLGDRLADVQLLPRPLAAAELVRQLDAAASEVGRDGVVSVAISAYEGGLAVGMRPETLEVVGDGRYGAKNADVAERLKTAGVTCYFPSGVATAVATP